MFKKKKSKSLTMKKSDHGGKSWRQFNSARMGKYMKSEGGHGPAIHKISREWKATMPRSKHKRKK